MPGILTKKKPPVGKTRRAKAVRPTAKGPVQPLHGSREEWLRQLRAEYTPAVSKQTLLVNEDFPVYGES